MANKGNPQNKPVAVVTGVGPGLGAALARRFAGDYAIAILARSADYLKGLANRDAHRWRGGDRTAVRRRRSRATRQGLQRGSRRPRRARDIALQRRQRQLGTITEITPSNTRRTGASTPSGAFLAAKEVAPAMIARGRGVMLFTGATAGVKAGPKSVSFGPAKFAMRGLAQSLARDLGPKGIHVAWINVDGSIDIPGARGRKPTLNDGDFLNPDAIAETYWHLAHQDRSAWTMELEVRPFKEKF